MYIGVHILFGLIVGSFLNVAILRSFTGKSLAGRSGCLSCGAQLSPWSLVPVISWLAQSGRCVSCGSRISRQYPLVELMTGALFGVVAGAGLPLLPHVAMLTLVALWVVIAVYDLRHTIVPDLWAYLAVPCAIVVATAMVPWPMVVSFVFFGWVAMVGPLFGLWFFSRGRAMGLGDSKLALSLGALLGPLYGFVALMTSFVIGALISVAVLLPFPWYRDLYTKYRKGGLRSGGQRFTMKSEVPFGPFLILGTLCIWILLAYGIDIPFWLGAGLL